MKLWLTLSLPLYVIDQITKVLVLKYIAVTDVIPVIPGFFNLVQVHNTGAAFGMGRGNNYFFIGLASVAIIVLAVLTWKNMFRDTPSRVASALLVAGVIGNLTDRILHGFVVDFIDIILPWYGRWPAFNVADSCICIAAGLFILSSFLDGKKKPAASSLAA